MLFIIKLFTEIPHTLEKSVLSAYKPVYFLYTYFPSLSPSLSQRLYQRLCNCQRQPLGQNQQFLQLILVHGIRFQHQERF